MRDYAKLIKNLRYCSEIGYESCAHCELYLKPSCERLKEDAADAVEELRRNLMDCRNELCLRCGDYKQSHLGACNGCRWQLTPQKEDAE